MGTTVTLHIETDDMDLAERIGRTLNGNLTEFVESRTCSEETNNPKPAALAAEGAERSAAPDTPDHASDVVEPDTAKHDASDRDADGLPWDERIHASTKGRNADGTWKKRRNVNAEYKKLVEQELRDAMALPQTEPPATAPGSDAQPPEPAPGSDTQTPAPAPEPQQDAPPPPAATADAPTTFMGLVGEIGKAGYGQAQINTALAACDPPVPTFQALGHREDLIPAFWEKLRAL